jgi:serine/threonine protein kinase
VQQIGGGGFSTYVPAFLPSLPLLFPFLLPLSHPRLHNSVYRAVNFEDHRVAACKLVLLTPSTSEKERKNIEKEMRVHAALKHTNVLEFLNAVVVEPKHRDIYVPGIYMLLELAAGVICLIRLVSGISRLLVGTLMDGYKCC